MRMRWRKSTALVIGVLLAASGCAIAPKAAESVAGSSADVTASATSSYPTLRVTVPPLPAVTEEVSSAAGSEESSAPEPSEPLPPTESAAARSTVPEEPTVPVSSAAATTTTSVKTTPTPATAPAPEPDPVPAAQPGTGVAVELVDCPGCSVIATRAAVMGELSAALISREGRVALLSVAADGAVRGAINVPYGSSFPAPANGVLACDATSKCILTAFQPDGTAIMSAFELTSTGAWRDISGDGAFPSATSKGGAVQLATGLGIAVQVNDGTTGAWMVLGWTGEFYTTAGCAPDGPLPTAAVLDPAKCLS